VSLLLRWLPPVAEPKDVTCHLVARFAVTGATASRMSLVASRSYSFVSNSVTSNEVTCNEQRFTFVTHRNSQIFISRQINHAEKAPEIWCFGQID